ncbi:MAG: 4Fe-4S binding protein, partial [Desulfovibrionaceae bacterium]
DPVYMDVPVVDETRCTGCRACSEMCQFKAIAVLAGKAMVFAEMCHGCGGCLAVCPEQALFHGRRELGEVELGRSGEVPVVTGRLRVGEAMSPPLIRAARARLRAVRAGRSFDDDPSYDSGDDLKKERSGQELGQGLEPAPDAIMPPIMDAVVDAPPGVSCPAVNAVQDADVILLVAEPTPFGLHDFALAWEAFKPLGRPVAVAVNRAGLGDGELKAFCARQGLPVLAEIPFDRAIARAYSEGRVISELGGELRRTFENLRDGLRALHGEVRHD